MLGALTVPPAEDEVARAAARVSDGALSDATVARWPRAHDHHAYLVTARDGREYLFKAARMRHPGRMRRYVHVAAMLKERDVPFSREAAMGKLFASEKAFAICDGNRQ